ENQKLFLMFDAVSAHTDCLIQIVKERRACRAELRRRILRFSLRKSSDCFRFSFGACFARKLAHQFGVFRRAGRGAL
ncbi:hypothetical protein, partial [Aeromonas veronii]|uniref:hypothetical protein n=1 Tax=Aeromonas veronii TaxID=654 RepID=UPI003BA03712